MAKFDPTLLDDIRARLPISDVIGRYVTWDRKKTKPGRGDFWAPCPLHAERSSSFHCEDAKGRYFCFGCGASGDHFKFVQEVDGLTFPRAVETLADMAGVQMPSAAPKTEAEKAEAARRRQIWERKKARQEQKAERDRERRVESAAGIWKGTKPLAGSEADVYLETRGLAGVADANIRCHPSLEWASQGERRGFHPALVARVQNAAGAGVAVWRIFLAPGGRGKADVPDAKLGFGPSSGGAVRLGGEGETIGIGEGIETCLAAARLDGRWPIWAGLSTSGIAGFDPPPFVKRIFVYPDGDRPKERDGKIYGPPGMEAALRLKARMEERGLECHIVEPPLGGDYLDVLNRSRRDR